MSRSTPASRVEEMRQKGYMMPEPLAAMFGITKATIYNLEKAKKLSDPSGAKRPVSTREHGNRWVLVDAVAAYRRTQEAARAARDGR